MQYIAQQKTLTGVIFHYANEDHVVESLFYTNDELDTMANVSPEFGEAVEYTSKGMKKPLDS